MSKVAFNALLAAALALAVVTGVAMAAGGTHKGQFQNNQSLLDAAFSQASCRTNFTVTFVNDTIGLAQNFSALSPQLTTLRQDTSQLQTYAGSGNSTQYRAFLTGTYDPQLRTISSQYRSIRHNVTLSNTIRQQIRADYNTTMTAEKSCELAALRQYSDAKVAIYRAILSQAQALENNLTARGLNGTGMAGIVQGATTGIITPMQNAVNGSTTPTGARAAIESYCLFNGCNTNRTAGAANYHFAAAFDLQKLTAILNYVKANSTFSNQSANENDAQTYLNDAGSALSVVGASRYQGGQSQQVWGNLTMAANTIRSILKNP